MSNDLAQALMEEFAEATDIVGNDAPPRRYLWTDAFAVCNFLGLYGKSGNDRYLSLARELVRQVHHVLGRHRTDDPRRGWISGLTEEEGERHPTRGGLRIGKKLNERNRDQSPDSRLEWDQDGQYFHYLTKWMHALHRMNRVTGEDCYLRWAKELAVAAHRSFTYQSSPGGPKRMVWKMSIDLSQPLVSSMGHHDPLDGLITFLELTTPDGSGEQGEIDLAPAIADMSQMCELGHWATEDALGIGGLLDAAVRLANISLERGLDRRDLLQQLLQEAAVSLELFARSSPLSLRAEHRLAFRELGLAIGLHALDQMTELGKQDIALSAIVETLLLYRSLAEEIEAFWSVPVHRRSSSWMDHSDINTVMLATSLAPEGYLNGLA